MVPVGGGGDVQIPNTDVLDNLPGWLSFQIPDSLASGDYRLFVRARIDGAATLRNGELDATLVVA